MARRRLPTLSAAKVLEADMKIWAEAVRISGAKVE